jgi:ribonuclease P protein component
VSVERPSDRTAKTGGFRRSDRLLDGRDYDRVLKRGKRRSSPELVVVTTACRPDPPRRDGTPTAPRPSSRLGITVGRKAGPSVERNRFKRRVREWFRRHRHRIERPVDIVVIARRPAVGLGMTELGERLEGLLELPNRETRETRKNPLECVEL